MSQSFRTAHVDDIQPLVQPQLGFFEWRPVRHRLGIQAFGVNAMVAKKAGDWAIEEHTEVDETGVGHEELYYVARGSARFRIDGEDFTAETGTFVFVPDPKSLRSARALEADTAVLAIGSPPGAPYTVKPWEAKYLTP